MGRWQLLSGPVSFLEGFPVRVVQELLRDSEGDGDKLGGTARSRDTLFQALREFSLLESEINASHGWLVSPSCSFGRGEAIGRQTGDQGWSFVGRLRWTVALFMRPWCNEGEVPSSVNANLYGGSRSHVSWRRGIVFWGPSVDRICQLRCMPTFRWEPHQFCLNEPLVCFHMVTFLFWVGLIRMNFSTVQVLIWRVIGVFLTFRWIKQHAHGFPLVSTVVASFLPTCAVGLFDFQAPLRGSVFFLVSLCELFPLHGSWSLVVSRPRSSQLGRVVLEEDFGLDTPLWRRSVPGLRPAPRDCILGETWRSQVQRGVSFSKRW